MAREIQAMVDAVPDYDEEDGREGIKRLRQSLAVIPSLGRAEDTGTSNARVKERSPGEKSQLVSKR